MKHVLEKEFVTVPFHLDLLVSQVILKNDIMTSYERIVELNKYNILLSRSSLRFLPFFNSYIKRLRR